MKNIIVFFTLMLLPSCSEMFYSGSSSSKSSTTTPIPTFAELNTTMEKNVNSYKGTSKQNLILNLGPPINIASDGTDKGEVYSYIRSFSLPYGLYTAYCYFYINEQGVVYFTKFSYTLK